MGGEVKKMKRSAGLDVAGATKILVIMTRKGISQTGLAEAIGVTHVCVNYTIWGKRKNKKTREAIAHELGFGNWEEMMNHREVV